MKSINIALTSKSAKVIKPINNIAGVCKIMAANPLNDVELTAKIIKQMVAQVQHETLRKSITNYAETRKALRTEAKASLKAMKTLAKKLIKDGSKFAGLKALSELQNGDLAKFGKLIAKPALKVKLLESGLKVKEFGSHLKISDKAVALLKAAGKTVDRLKEDKEKLVAGGVGKDKAASGKGKSGSLTDHAFDLMADAMSVIANGTRHKSPANIAKLKLIKELEAVAGSTSVVDKFFKSKGISVNLGKSELAAGSYMKVDMEWVKKAEKTKIKGYSASKHSNAQSIATSVIDGITVYRIAAKNNNYVTVYIPKSAAQQSEAFLEKVVKAKYTKARLHLAVPNVKLIEQKDLSSRLRKIVPDADKAFQVTDFTMDEVGARVVQYAAGTTKSIKPKLVTIDKPFVAVMHRTKVEVPIYAAMCGVKTWLKK